MKKSRKKWILAVFIALLSADMVMAMQPFTIHGKIYNGSEGGVEEGVQVKLNYTYLGVVNSQEIITGPDGAFSFTITDYDVPSTYELNSTKGSYQGPLMLDSILSEGGNRDFGDFSIYQNSTIYRIVPRIPVINKGDSIDIVTVIDPNGVALEGIQMFYNFSDFLALNSLSEGDPGLFFGSNTTPSSGRYGMKQGENTTFSYAAIIGPGYNTNVVFNHSVYNATGAKNGTANLTFDNTLTVSRATSWHEISWARSTVYSSILKITQRCDVNGDFSCNIADLSKINQYWNKSGPNLCPEVWGRCDLNRDGKVNIIDKTIEQQGYGKPIIKGQ